LASALALGGCMGGASAPSAQTRGPAIAFDSIDGAPRPVFDRLVASLDAEARARGLPVVTRAGEAAYRVRGYLAAMKTGREAAIVWVWDVYDANAERRLRVAGREPAGRGTANAWARADERMLRKIAHQGVQAFAQLLALPEPRESAPERAPAGANPRPRPPGPAVAQAGRDDARSQDTPAILAFADRPRGY